MKRIVLSLLLLSLLVVGCDKKETVEETKGSGVKECDQYVAALESCIANMHEDQRAPMEKQLRTQRDALSKGTKVQKKQMRKSCRTGVATLKADKRCKKL
jgi:hypothetical protein